MPKTVVVALPSRPNPSIRTRQIGRRGYNTPARGTCTYFVRYKLISTDLAYVIDRIERNDSRVPANSTGCQSGVISAIAMSKIVRAAPFWYRRINV